MDPTVSRYQILQRAFEEAVLKCASEFELQSNSVNDSELSCTLRDAVTKASLILIELKAASRNAHLHFADCRQKVMSRRKQMDSTHLQLKNLLYEKDHLLREIYTCNEHITPELDRMACDEGVQSILGNVFEALSPDAHSSNLELLRDDIDARENSRVMLIEAQNRFTELIASIEERRKWLQSLPDALVSVEKASRSLEAYTGSKRVEKRIRQQEAVNLAKPLYVLFCQFEAYCNAFGAEEGISISVVPAMQYNIPERIVIQDEKFNSINIPPMKRLKYRHPSPDKIIQKALQSNEVDQPLGNDQFVSAEKAVEMRITLRNMNDISVVLRFQYLINLGVVVAEVIKGPRYLLHDLFPGDDGIQSPNVENYHLKSFDLSHPSCQNSFQFPLESPARPYKWVQWLAGLQFTDSKQEPLEPSTRAVMKRIQSRLETYISLETQLQQLKAGTLPAPHPCSADFFPPNISELRCIFSWEEIKASYYETRADSKLPDPIFKPGYRTFRCRLKVLDVEVEVQIQLYPDYPVVPPTISIHGASETAIFETIETEVNRYCEELMGKDIRTWNMILSHQLRCVCMCLNVAITQPSPSGDPERGALRGRLRSLPFMFSAIEKGFIHR